MASSSSQLLAGWLAGCDRLVHPTVTDSGERALQRRLVGTMLLMPFFYGAAAAQAFAGVFDVATIFAALCAILGIGWLGPVLLAATGNRHATEALVAAAGIVTAGAVIAIAGGPSSPLALLLLPLVAEPYWVHGTRRAAGVGVLAAAAAIALQPVVAHFLLADVSRAAASAWLWLLPAAYCMSLWVRFSGNARSQASGESADAGLPFDVLGEAVLMRMNGNGDVRDVSEQAHALFGLPADLLLGDGFFDRIHVADRLAWLCALADLREGARSRRLELRLRLPSADGRGPSSGYRPFSAELVRPGEAEGGIFAVLRDNAELAGLRDALAAAREGLESNEVAKSRFLAAVSHELRTPLNAIIGFSDMLLHEMFGGFTDPRQREYAGLIRESGNHLLAVVNSILDVSKIESGAYTIHPEPFAFAEAAEMCRSMMAHQAETKGIALAQQIDAGAGEIHADRRAVQQILINLLSNAVKFTPEGGRISLGAKRLGSRLHFWVADTGIGIAEEDLARLGEPFMQVQNDYTRRYDGTGLGLSLVKGLVALHEGTMSIESAPGEGTTVTISLPCDGPSRAQPKPTGQLVPIMREKMKEGHDGALRKTA